MAVKQRLLFEESGFSGPYLLDQNLLEGLDDDDFGVYVIVTPDVNDDPGACYVGRGCFRDRMRQHVKRYDNEAVFLKQLQTDGAAFREECRLFHVYGKRHHLDNRIHPAVPAGSSWTKKRCTELGCKGEAG